ncbi:MAG: hypothetical protein ACREMH_11650 [Gemmatimonadales bacterium]
MALPPTPHLPPRLLLGLLPAASAACSDDAGPGPADPLEREPDQAVHVDVEQDGFTRFTWTPGCGMASLQVMGPGGGWVLYSGEDAAENPIGPGVTYGFPPEGTLEPSPAASLQSGAEYVVTVYRWIGEPGGPGSLFPKGSSYFQAR